MVLAFGLTLVFAGLVTNWVIGLLGILLMLPASIGWFRQVLPHEQRESVTVLTEIVPIVSTRASVARMPISKQHRARLPIETYTIGAGIRGGLAGAAVMAVLAILYGLIRYGSIWYAVNLLAAAVYANYATATTAEISAFHLRGLIVASLIHLITSLLVGSLYGAMLPMFPKRPIVMAGFLAPFIWTGLIYSILGIVNPLLNQRIDWLWFVASQCAFGLVAGFVVNLSAKVRTRQSLPFAVRAGLESPGLDADEGHPK